ncbi:sigma-54-dependent transcriptional regulator [Parafilimonas sp.]|uniref:sigma-54-dependent transcriptional regulator n=1 Tax=Parafilimonas sp. TaxID=1969739 RepID=UPI0039E39CCE
MASRILIIDDEEKLRSLLSRIISLEGFTVTQAGDLMSASRILQKEAFDVLLCDVKLPDGNGVDFVKEVKEKYPLTEVILLTAYGNIPDGVQAMKNGAFDYLLKGDDNDKIIPLLNQAINKSSQNKKAAIKIKNKSVSDFNEIIGNSTAIQQAIHIAQKIAATDATVLLLGETGTGKEVFAHAIHGNSKRASKAFVAVNCSAFTKELLESELFGHLAGAFTGAAKEKKGLIEVADGGTLLLDEIGEMNIELQAKLLRVLENGEFIKLGDTKISKVDVRIIAATNKDLKKSIEDGSFREDLFYRLNVFSIHLPALRERLDDIPALANYFLDVYAAKENKNAVQLSDDAIKLLKNYAWKGNIRELRNVMERAVILADDIILPEHLPYEIQNQNNTASNNLSLSNVEKNHIQKVLQYTRGNKTKAAEYLGIGLTTLYRKIEEYHLTP